MPAHPRSRGENSQLSSSLSGTTGSSPLTRGKPSAWTWRAGCIRLIPAHAGKTAGPTKPPKTASAHPRSRGENRRISFAHYRYRGSSPLTRGKRKNLPYAGKDARLIPAHAGKTFVLIGRSPLRAAHPRSRGENEAGLGGHDGGSGSSPLTRGKLEGECHRVCEVRLIPAHAGKTRADGRGYP